MRKKSSYTPRSRIRSALRGQLWLRSRERAAALKIAGRKCEACGVKASEAKGKEQKVEVHHREGIDWEKVIDIIYDRILIDPKGLIVLCKKCHKQIHKK